MKRSALTAFLLIVASSVVIVLAQQPLGQIEGIVVNATTGRPLSGAKVTVTSGTGNPRPSTIDRQVALIFAPLAIGRGNDRSLPSATTRADGKFSLTVDPGAYRVIADASGYAPGELGQRSVVGLGTPIEVHSGQTLNNLTIKLTASGVIAGRIFESSARPAAQVSVMAFRAVYSVLGQKVLEFAATGSTNDRGEFRFFDLMPGQYFVKAGGMAAADAGPPRPLSTLEAKAYAPTYHPGVGDLAQATPLVVRSGEESRTNLIVTGVERFRISGKVLDAQTGRPSANGSVALFYPALRGGVSRADCPVDPATGSFSFENLIPGTYTLSAVDPVPVRVPPGGAGIEECRECSRRTGCLFSHTHGYPGRRRHRKSRKSRCVHRHSERRRRPDHTERRAGYEPVESVSGARKPSHPRARISRAVRP